MSCTGTQIKPSEQRRSQAVIFAARTFTALLALLAPLLITSPEASADVSSYAFVQDDGSLRISGKTYRLYGIYIPPTDQTCRSFERPVVCGTHAALALDFKIGVDFVKCMDKQRNEDGSVNAVCSVNGEDLAAYLLERGWALALPDAPFAYTALERIARERHMGVWGIPLG